MEKLLEATEVCFRTSFYVFARAQRCIFDAHVQYAVCAIDRWVCRRIILSDIILNIEPTMVRHEHHD